ncbi:MAG TPA: DUF3347 domain-containing protein [Puia sp.]
MKKLFFTLALLATVYLQQSIAQNQLTPASPLLSTYYGIKNALVNSDANTAASQAAAFQKTLQAIDMKSLPDTSMTVFMSLQGKLTKDAAYIAGNKDISRQREHFTTLSANMFTLVKALKLSSQPVYYDYCPMKKAYWLSSEATIKNPYFGNQMLTCGKTTETLNN